MKPDETFQHQFGASKAAGLFFLFLLLSVSMFAQEHSFGKEENGNNEPVVENQLHDNDHVRTAPSGQDSVFIQRSVVRPRFKNTESTTAHQADAAKFNFIYFIFEKFKITDIID